ncbi:hypothetical protein OG230_03820 [Streptomyces sp. NBC_00234]|nr:hypothetical protein [Streptomyces sp. NBC_00234]
MPGGSRVFLALLAGFPAFLEQGTRGGLVQLVQILTQLDLCSGS